MKIVLIYDIGDRYQEHIKIKEFEDETEMINFVNNENIGEGIRACYEVRRQIQVEPFERVTEYRVKE